MDVQHRYKTVSALFIALISLSIVGCLGSSSGIDENMNRFPSTANPGFTPQAFLSDSNFTALELEIDYMPGQQPTQAALDSLKNFLQNRLNKSQVTINTPTEVASAGEDSYSAEEIRELEGQYRNNFTDSRGNTLHAYFLIVDGKYQAQENVLGIAYFNTSMAFFGQTISEVSSGIGAPPKEKIEGTVFQHEFGHTFGLVGSGTPTQSDHKTAASAHCTTEGCLMEPSVETANFFANLFDGDIPDLDSACIADLQANGGK
ncbi:hypothetical protein [Fodinibius salsisoli]|uniref:Peptidase n=1 Tax=Fodinibius salsisoli TaxID=2820877 RepID=A0ABT3PLV9_9BACT|nr:hypothetical protein [Fodinibius salsisoli]MCW9706938.1 hypothetical protein [Fodinibius salsisoli]